MKKVWMAGMFALVLGAPVVVQAAGPVVEVYKTETCGCCTAWIDHLKENGFEVVAHNVPTTAAYRSKLGMPEQLGSCHTARIGGYVVEGHVPAKEIKRLLAEKPRAVGLSVPGMPMGSPGMEGPRADAYDVVLVQKDGRHQVYQHYDGK